MHFDTRLLGVNFVLIVNCICNCQLSIDQSYLSFVEFNRGGSSTNIILSSPHGGFLGADTISRKPQKYSLYGSLTAPLVQLPIGGCYNNTLERCIYTLRDCLRPDSDNSAKISFHPDARCVIDRSSTPAMYSLTKSIAEAFSPATRPFTIFNKLTFKSQ